MCIYYKNRTDLNMAVNREHIFPAFLGGMTRLPLGYVSDEANAFFSPIEKKFSMSSIIAIERMSYGPGKRGTEKLGTPNVKIGEVDGKVGLYYVFKRTSHTAPHIFLKKDLSQISYSQDKPNIPSSESDILDNFIIDLGMFNGKYVDLKSEMILNDELLFGFINEKFIIGHSQNSIINIDEISQIIDKLKTNEIHAEKISIGNNAPSIEIKLEENEDFARIYAKIGFNALAYIMGEKFVLQECFDDIREIIMGNGKSQHNVLPTIKHIFSLLESKVHYSIFSVNNGHLIATVGLYNSWIRCFDFGILSDPRCMPSFDGFVCDWQNKKEYRIIDFIAVAQEENKF